MAKRASKSTGLGVGCRIMLGLAAGVLVLVVMSPFALRTWRVWGLPDDGEPFDVQAYRDRTVSDDINAALDFRAAAGLYVSSIPNEERFRTGPIKLTDVDLESQAWVDANEPALDRWLAGTDKLTVEFVKPDYSSFTHDGGPLHILQHICKLVQLKSLQLQHAGDFVGAWKWLAALFRCSRQLGQNDPSIARLIGVNLFSRAAEATVHWSAGAPPHLTAQALAEIHEIYSRTISASESIRREYINTMNFLDTVPAYEFWLQNEPRVSKLTIMATTANWLEYADLPRNERPFRRAGTLTKLYAVPDRIDARTADAIENGATGELYIGLTLEPDLVYLADLDLARYSMLVTALRLRLWHHDHGSFPERLQPLALPALPDDPFANPAAPFHYRKDGEGFVIWSVGKNGVDDDATFDDRYAHGDFGWKVEQ